MRNNPEIMAIQTYIAEKDVFNVANVIASRKRFGNVNIATVFLKNEEDIRGTWRDLLEADGFREAIDPYSVSPFDLLRDLFGWMANWLDRGSSNDDGDGQLDLAYYLVLATFVRLAYKERPFAKDFFQEVTIKDFKQFDMPKDIAGLSLYRGQCDCDWAISPSVLRDLGRSIFLNDNSYYTLTKENGLFDKWKMHMRLPAGHAYQRYSFFQHACSFSPLIDFTSDPLIAASFALANAGAKNVFLKQPAVIYELQILDDGKERSRVIDNTQDARDFLKYKFSITALETDTFVLGKAYPYQRIDPSGKRITEKVCCTNIRDAIDKLTPRFVIIDCPTNDRMIYQKGKFLVFYSCIALKGRILYELNHTFVPRKYVIPPEAKTALLTDIYQNHRSIDPEHLMNPYLFFQE